MKLGAFSISLSVKDLAKSTAFYKSIGFEMFADHTAKNYVVLKNGNALVGLYQGMFEGNMLTFNPGWDENAKETETFDDVRDIQAFIQGNGISLTTEADASSSGPAWITLEDPDGNTILIDQHR